MRAFTGIVALALVLAACTPGATAAPTNAPQPLQTLAPSPAPSQTPSPGPTTVPTPTQFGGGSARFIFTLRQPGPDTSVFTSNADGSDLAPVPGTIKGGQHIEDVSQDGQMALISAYSGSGGTGTLYLAHLGAGAPEPAKLGSGLLDFWSGTTDRQAMFLGSDRVIYVGSGAAGAGIYVVGVDGSDPHKIATYGSARTSLQAVNDRQVFWSQNERKTFKDSYGSRYEFGDFSALYWANLDGSGQGKLESGGVQIVPDGYAYWHYFAFSRDGKKLAWIPAQTEPDCTLLAAIPALVKNGTETKNASKPPSGVYDMYRSLRDQNIDMAWLGAYVRRCFILYTASVDDLDHPTRVVLMPPAELMQGNFSFGRGYALTWLPDEETLLLFNDGHDINYQMNGGHQPVLYEVNTGDPAPALKEVRHSQFGDVRAGTIEIGALSPDGRQLVMVNQSNGADLSIPYVTVVDVATGARQSSFVTRVAPGPGAANELDALRLCWLP